jgi:hypothetical protein
VFPYVRDISITFTGNKLKPNTKMYAFFNEYNVTDLCYSSNTTANVVSSFGSGEMNQTNIITDQKGSVTGVFNFRVAASGLKIPAGRINFRLTDSATNGSNKESFADAIFNANGTLSKTEPPRVTYTPSTTATYTPSAATISVVGGTIVAGGGDNTTVGETVISTGTGTVVVGGNTVTTDTGTVVVVQNISSTVTTTTTGFADHAAAFLQGVSITTLSTEDRTTYENYYKTSLANSGVTEATFQTQLATAPLAGTGYRSGANDIYAFESSDTAAYKTATNILDVRNPNTNDLFIADVKTTVGDPYWNAVVIPVYEGTKAAVADAVHESIHGGATLNKDMQDFWNVGVANGSFPVTDEGIQKAIEAYSAAITLAVIEAPASANFIADGASRGLLGSTTTITV